MSLKHELQDIISGNGSVRYGEPIQAIAAYLRGKKKTVPEAERAKCLKKEETQDLIEYIEARNLWYNELYENQYIGEGAEQKIYELADSDFVLKINDSIFYEFWEDYFYSILIHNFFFSHLAYELLGFRKQQETLYAIVKQHYVEATEVTDLDKVREFLIANGFVNKKNNDFYHPELGIILEDLHDENVITSYGALQFIDTVFFITPKFYEP